MKSEKETNPKPPPPPPRHPEEHDAAYKPLLGRKPGGGSIAKRIASIFASALLLTAAITPVARAQGPSLCFDAKGLHVDFTQAGPASTPIWTAKISVDGTIYFLGVDAR